MVENTLLLQKPEANAEVVAFYNQSLQLKVQAEARVITSNEDLMPATDDLKIIGMVKKEMEGRRKAYLLPFQNHIKETNEAYNAIMEPIEQADKITRGKMLAFGAEQERIRKEQAEINRKRQEAAEAEERLLGKTTEPVNLVEVTPEVPLTTFTGDGAAGLTAHWKYEVIDFALVPDEYKMIDNAQLSAIAKRHHDTKQISGVRFYNEPIVSLRG